MYRFVRVCVLAVVVVLTLASPAWAYMNCSATVTAYSNGSQMCEETCHFYSNETGAYQGYITREWQC